MDTEEEAGPSSRDEEPAEPKFQAFVGAGRRLDGKAASAPTVQPPPSSGTRKTGLSSLDAGHDLCVVGQTLEECLLNLGRATARLSAD